MAIDQTHAVSKITENLNQQGTSSLQEGGGRTAPGKEAFQSLLNPSTSTPSVVDPRSIPVEAEADIANSPTLGEDNVTTQKSGTSTDDQNQKNKKGQEKTEEISSTSSTKKQKETASLSENKITSTGKSHIEPMSTEGVQKEIEKALVQMEAAKEKLSQPGTTLKPSHQNLVRNRLGHIDESIKIALSKTGTEYTPPPIDNKDKTANPLVRFMDAFTNSENQLNHLHASVEKLGGENTRINPADLLAIQMKMNYVQQQIELLTNLLNKALESTKTIMNVQV